MLTFICACLALVCTSVPVSAIENLNCESALNPNFEIIPGSSVRLKRDQILVRGYLEEQAIVQPVCKNIWGVRDELAMDKIFPAPEDSYHQIQPGDRIYLITSQGKIFRHGYFGVQTRNALLDVDGRLRECEQSYPHLFDDVEGKIPKVSSERLVQMFEENYDVVVIKRITEEDRARMQLRLNAQLERYHAHLDSPARYLEVTPEVRHELRWFETVLTGRLRSEWPRFPHHVDLAQDKQSLHYLMTLSLEHGDQRTPVREGDQIFILDGRGEILSQFAVSQYPIKFQQPNMFAQHRALIEALGREERTILVRRETR